MKLDISRLERKAGDPVVIKWSLLRLLINPNLGRVGIDQSIDLMYKDEKFDNLYEVNYFYLLRGIDFNEI